MTRRKMRFRRGIKADAGGRFFPVSVTVPLLDLAGAVGNYARVAQLILRRTARADIGSRGRIQDILRDRFARPYVGVERSPSIDFRRDRNRTVAANLARLARIAFPPLNANLFNWS